LIDSQAGYLLGEIPLFATGVRLIPMTIFSNLLVIILIKKATTISWEISHPRKSGFRDNRLVLWVLCFVKLPCDPPHQYRGFPGVFLLGITKRVGFALPTFLILPLFSSLRHNFTNKTVHGNTFGFGLVIAYDAVSEDGQSHCLYIFNIG
jgi:hypothetical protein